MIYRFKKSDWYELLFIDLADNVIFYEKYWWSDCYVVTERKTELVKTLRIGKKFIETKGSGIIWG